MDARNASKSTAHLVMRHSAFEVDRRPHLHRIPDAPKPLAWWLESDLTAYGLDFGGLWRTKVR